MLVAVFRGMSHQRQTYRLHHHYRVLSSVGALAGRALSNGSSSTSVRIDAGDQNPVNCRQMRLDELLRLILHAIAGLV